MYETTATIQVKQRNAKFEHDELHRWLWRVAGKGATMREFCRDSGMPEDTTRQHVLDLYRGGQLSRTLRRTQTGREYAYYRDETYAPVWDYAPDTLTCQIFNMLTGGEDHTVNELTMYLQVERNTVAKRVGWLWRAKRLKRRRAGEGSNWYYVYKAVN